MRASKASLLRLVFLCCAALQLAAASFVVSPAQAAPGDLDAGFGSGGVVLTGFPNPGGGQSAAIRSVAIQKDGKIVAAGLAADGGDRSQFALARYNSDGSLDSTFGPGKDGTVRTSFGLGVQPASQAVSVTIQPDGKIVAAGGAFDLSSYGVHEAALARYNSDGTPDTTFGPNHDGKVLTQFAQEGTSPSSEARSVALDTNGKIVVAGYGTDPYYRYFVTVARYNGDGSLDSSFGSDPGRKGMVIDQLGFGSRPSSDVASVLTQSNGKVVVVGNAWDNGAPSSIALARFSSDGSLDTTFGPKHNGNVVAPFGPAVSGASPKVNSGVIQTDGKIVVAGSAAESLTSGSSQTALSRFNSDGSLESTFGSDHNGQVVVPLDPGAGWTSFAFASALQADGKLVTAGYRSDSLPNGSFAAGLTRLNSDGTLDSGFGASQNGRVVSQIGLSDRPRSVFQSLALQPDGKIVAAGLASDSSGYQDFAVARFEGSSPVPGVQTTAATTAQLACVSRRRLFRIHVRRQAGREIKSARIFVNNKAVKVVRGKRTWGSHLNAEVDLRNLPKGAFKVKIVAKVTGGKTVKGHRSYRTCTTRGERSQTAKRHKTIKL